MHLRLSPLHVLTALSTLAVVLIILTIMLIAFTNLREFIPGYPSQQLRRQITQNALRVDSLLNEVQKKDRFLHSIQTILRDENLDTTSFVSMQQNVKVTYDTSMLGMSEEEAGFREIVEKEEKYNSPIAQGGTNVSGGQKQRLSIARAIAKNPKIFLFDDSFSALDYKTDVALRKKLNERVKDATVLIVAQRISTILHADKIIVLEEGRIAGIGTHEELLAGCETYQEIASSQLSEAELKGGVR